ncbi:hypothetical protein [Allochromatium palmeri]|uniref:HpcH/HpaI aldolase/citrate lyase domain-containing protein n=1 Tax=Allochromatium palmeri TaxID=231048 RepID=A0A6N8EGQ8_9GAMM|nr:hypothetical protein [Allochromatium palmeri]MTW22760.1 hypothetical protein [Allochromatium palmeri]
MQSPLELVLFENDAASARRHMAWGISSFMIDWEVMGKDFRQLGFDTEIRPGTVEDLKGIASLPGARAWCRINRYGSHTASEVGMALDAGAQVILLPMVSELSKVASFVEMIDHRCETGLMIETMEGAALAPQLRGFPIDLVFFGLNDFAISRGGGSIFRALADGAVERVRRAIPEIRFGVGGLTDLRRGYPIPSTRLLSEEPCQWSFPRLFRMRSWRFGQERARRKSRS